MPQGNNLSRFPVPPGFRRSAPAVRDKVEPIQEKDLAAVKVHVPGIIVKADIPCLHIFFQLFPGHPFRDVRVIFFRYTPCPQRFPAFQHTKLCVKERVCFPGKSVQAVRPWLIKFHRVAANQSAHSVHRHNMCQFNQFRHGVGSVQCFQERLLSVFRNIVVFQHGKECFTGQQFSFRAFKIPDMFLHGFGNQVTRYLQQGIQSFSCHACGFLSCFRRKSAIFTTLSVSRASSAAQAIIWLSTDS